MKKYDYILRPHHVKSLINFYKNKYYQLSEIEYVNQFQIKNKGYHNDKFVKYWRLFLLNLLNDKNKKVLYLNDYDDICINCDIYNECNNKNSKLRKLVNKLDDDFLNTSLFEVGEVYTVNEILK